MSAEGADVIGPKSGMAEVRNAPGLEILSQMGVRSGLSLILTSRLVTRTIGEQTHSRCQVLPWVLWGHIAVGGARVMLNLRANSLTGSMGVLTILLGVSGCAAPTQPEALHKAALTVRVLAERGGQTEEIVKSLSTLEIEFEAQKNLLPANVFAECNYASQVAQSARHIYSTLRIGSREELAELKSDFALIGLSKTPDWDQFVATAAGSNPDPVDTPMIADYKTRIRKITGETVGKATQIALRDSARQCEQDTEHVDSQLQALLKKI